MIFLPVLAVADLFAAVMESQQVRSDIEHGMHTGGGDSDGRGDDSGWSMDVYVINLLHRVDRRSYQEKQLREAGLLHRTNFIAAVNGRETSQRWMQSRGMAQMQGWSLDARNATFVDTLLASVRSRCGRPAARKLKYLVRGFWMRPVQPGEVGCMLSHLHAWERICDKDDGPALVMEDDTRLYPGFRWSLPKYLRVLPPGWDLLYLIHAPRVPGWYSPPSSGLIGRAEFQDGLQAYVVSANGACKMARAFDRQNIVAADEFVPAISAPHLRPDMRALYEPTISAFACRPAAIQDDPVELVEQQTQLGGVSCGLVTKSDLHEASDIEVATKLEL